MTEPKNMKSNIFLTLSCLMCIFVAQIPQALAHDAVVNQQKANGDAEASTHDLVQGSHVEGHIAFLKTELGITPAQENLWMPVAAAMREDVRNLQEAENKIGRKPRADDAITYLQNRVLFANLRAEGEARFLAALEPLYNALSPKQQQAADALLIPDRGGMHDE